MSAARVLCCEGQQSGVFGSRSMTRAAIRPVNAQILFDRFHIVKHLHEAVDAVRRNLWRQLASKERVTFKGTRWLLLKNPWNLNNKQSERQNAKDRSTTSQSYPEPQHSR